MGKTLRYMLYATVCIVSLIIVLICLWWATTKYYTKEDFIVPAPYMMMAAINEKGDVFYADMDVPINPRWIRINRINVSGSPSEGNIFNIEGSYGQIYAIPFTGGYNVGYGPYESMDADGKFTETQLKDIRVDDDGTSIGIDKNNRMVYGSDMKTFTTLTDTAKSIAVSGGQAFAIGMDDALRYYPSSKSSANAVIVRPGGKTAWKQVAYDGTVCALQTDGTMWCADNNISDGTRWVQQGSRKFNTLSIRGGRLVGLGTDGKPYYSNTYVNPTWTALPTRDYDKNTAEEPPARQFWINSTNSLATLKSSEIPFTKIILFYPASDARRKRFAISGMSGGSGNACGQDEEKIGNFCYAPCFSGRPALGTKCPFRRKQTEPLAACPSGEYINGSCYQPCPDTSMTAKGELCVGKIVTKEITGKDPNTTPESYSCGDGTVGARYIRIRPTNLPAVQNNKLCISKVVVKDKDGNVLSLLSGMPSVKSTIGSISGKYVAAGFAAGGLGTIPILSAQKIDVPGPGSSTVPLTIYVAEEGGYTKMVASDTDGTAKYYSGAASAWTSAYWTNGSSAGNRATGGYILTLHANPVTSTATDGTCIDTPIGGGSCTSAWSTYVSSTKYDTEADGGRVSRTTKTYWDLDLGGIQQIRTIEFTGCNYVPATGATATAIDNTTVSEPNADQITGMRIQLLESENLPTTQPIAERSLGPKKQQILTFNYLTKEPGIDDTCYDACPKINGVQSVDGGQQTCVSASGGMTSRSITMPLKLPPPKCSLPTNPDGTPYKMAAKKEDDSAWEIGNWVINPTTPSQVLSCDVLPGSKLMPLNNSVNIPITTNSSPKTITYTLQGPGNKPYTAKDPLAPYKCVKLDDNMCKAYGNFTLRGELCVKADTADPELNNDVWVPQRSQGANLRTTWEPACPYGTWQIGGECWGKQCSGGCYQDNCFIYPWDSCAKQIDVIKVSSLNRTATTAQYCDGTDELFEGWCYQKCPDGYTRMANSAGKCFKNNGNPGWGRSWWGQADGRLGGNTRYKYGLTGLEVLKNVMLGRPTVSSPPDSSISSPDNFKIPLIPEDKKFIADPQTFPAQCKCLNADGTVNTQATVYNDTCVKCASSTQLFYPRGAISNTFAWGDEQKNKYLSIYDDKVTRPIDQKPFSSLNDAKRLCETDSFCTGVTRSYDAKNTPYYYLRAGSVLKGTRPTTTGSVKSSATLGSGSSSSSSCAGSTDCTTMPTFDSSWLKGPQGSTKVTVGLRKGKNYSTVDIPSAFADDYLSPVPRASSAFSIIPSTVTDLINSMTNEVLQTASAFASYQNSVQNPNTYYQLVGVERQLKATTKPPDNGICVAPCDPKHSLHDPIQMIYDDTGDMFVLYGTTCHDATQSVISKPSIPAVYTPQVGAECKAGYDLTTGGSCIKQCDSNSTDNGSNCFGNSIRRPSIAPKLSCPSGLTLVGGACLHPCGPGYIDDGDYCEPVVNTVPIPSSINCTKTAYTYSTKYLGSGTPTSVNKWLCDSDYDQYTLLQGPSTLGSAYVNPKDIVCYADDSSSGMYYCQTVTEARNEIANTGGATHSVSCDSMTRAYLDLSNNLTTLLSAQSSARNASAQSAAIQITLKGVVEQLCGSSGSSGSSSLCNTLRTQLASLSSNINSGSGALSGVLSPIAVAASSRDNLVTLLRDMKCCPAGQTQYPWC